MGPVVRRTLPSNYSPRPPRANLQRIWDDPELSPKIRDACRLARQKGYRYIWIDSCCIDKSSSSELSEAINSMYKWYGLAAVCYVYLADVPPGQNPHYKRSAFRRSQWFTRGWTLQELIAPFWVEFVSKDWTPIGSKLALVDLVENVTKIDYKALLHLEPLEEFSIAQRLSWAAGRKTTRKEDRAYSLLGIFNIYMPILYGEGDHAFRRLQEEIMQRIPDQSLFAWGHRYLSFELSDRANRLKAPRATVQTHQRRQQLFALSPKSFKGCESIRTARRDTGKLRSSTTSNGHKISYTSTPYGISTELQMVPLTRDLLLHTIPHEDVQLDFSGSPEGSQWYLAILRCDHGEHPGHFWGRVCHITSSEEFDVQFVFTGQIRVDCLGLFDLFLLSPETIEHYRQHMELKTVYIPHSYRATLPWAVPWSLQHQPYTAIKLLLLRDTRNALRARGYSAHLLDPDPDHPTTHRLALSKDEYTIIVAFHHTLEDDGKKFTIEARAEIKMSESCAQLDSAAPDSDQADLHTVSWTPRSPWMTKLAAKEVSLSAMGAETLTLDLRLDFAGSGYYILRVDVLSDATPASPAVNQAADPADDGSGVSTAEVSLAGEANWEEAEEEGGREVTSAGTWDVGAVRDDRIKHWNASCFCVLA
ncbi:hypothetical protein GSI_08737 [Ganoderma sinense ZZ0214-1]|uniref:Uncharacterized protein n=1 Tax=Ganoderma sinense ZZ0214-1 TaxID=1077348 RepID=A0A2G8S4J0_9APHY|nr:hypothetical protein GSI_08737 [Ganoderma sinense ZZ0214-1]